MNLQIRNQSRKFRNTRVIWLQLEMRLVADKDKTKLHVYCSFIFILFCFLEEKETKTIFDPFYYIHYFILEQKQLELPNLVTNSISSDRNLRYVHINRNSANLINFVLSSLSADEGQLILSSNNNIDISARQTLDFVANDIVIKAHTVNSKN